MDCKIDRETLNRFKDYFDFLNKVDNECNKEQFKYLKIKVYQKDNIYFISHCYFPCDFNIACAINISYFDYIIKLSEDFGAYGDLGFICFETKEEAEKALEWIHAMYIANKLI